MIVEMEDTLDKRWVHRKVCPLAFIFGSVYTMGFGVSE